MRQTRGRKKGSHFAFCNHLEWGLKSQKKSQKKGALGFGVRTKKGSNFPFCHHLGFLHRRASARTISTLVASSDVRVAPIALRRRFSESRMREIRPSGLMRGGSRLTHLGQLLPTPPPLACPFSLSRAAAKRVATETGNWRLSWCVLSRRFHCPDENSSPRCRRCTWRAGVRRRHARATESTTTSAPWR